MEDLANFEEHRPLTWPQEPPVDVAGPLENERLLDEVEEPRLPPDFELPRTDREVHPS